MAVDSGRVRQSESINPVRGLPLAGVVVPVLLLEVGLFWLPLWLGMKPGRYTRDSNPIAVLSCLNLLACAFLCWKRYRLERPAGAKLDWRRGETLWLLMSMGLVYLAVDEGARIHENVSVLVHRHILHAERTSLTARLDDALIGLYLVAAIAVLYRYRHVLARFTPLRTMLTIGLVFAAVMVLLDAVTHREDMLAAVLPPDSVRPAFLWLSVLEEQFKILAEATFLAGFLHTWLTARQRKQPAEP